MAKRNVAANSPLERTSLAYLDQRLAMAKHCSHGNAYFTIIMETPKESTDLNRNQSENNCLRRWISSETFKLYLL
jgi:hypothetical protein